MGFMATPAIRAGMNHDGRLTQAGIKLMIGKIAKMIVK